MQRVTATLHHHHPNTTQSFLLLCQMSLSLLLLCFNLLASSVGKCTNLSSIRSSQYKPKGLSSGFDPSPSSTVEDLHLRFEALYMASVYYSTHVFLQILAEQEHEKYPTVPDITSAIGTHKYPLHESLMLHCVQSFVQLKKWKVRWRSVRWPTSVVSIQHGLDLWRPVHIPQLEEEASKAQKPLGILEVGRVTCKENVSYVLAMPKAVPPGSVLFPVVMERRQNISPFEPLILFISFERDSTNSSRFSDFYDSSSASLINSKDILNSVLFEQYSFFDGTGKQRNVLATKARKSTLEPLSQSLLLELARTLPFQEQSTCYGLYNSLPLPNDVEFLRKCGRYLASYVAKLIMEVLEPQLQRTVNFKKSTFSAAAITSLLETSMRILIPNNRIVMCPSKKKKHDSSCDVNEWSPFCYRIKLNIGERLTCPLADNILLVTDQIYCYEDTFLLKRLMSTFSSEWSDNTVLGQAIAWVKEDQVFSNIHFTLSNLSRVSETSKSCMIQSLALAAIEDHLRWYHWERLYWIRLISLFYFGQTIFFFNKSFEESLIKHSKLPLVIDSSIIFYKRRQIIFEEGMTLAITYTSPATAVHKAILCFYNTIPLIIDSWDPRTGNLSYFYLDDFSEQDPIEFKCI